MDYQAKTGGSSICYIILDAYEEKSGIAFSCYLRWVLIEACFNEYIQ